MTDHELIPLPILIEYYRLGFKLIPLCNDGIVLYLNELDIDDKEIFTQLSIVSIKDQDHYFLDDIGKETYGVHTRKEWGRRYYWLSHQQEKPIRSNDCKVGHRFEIKT